ncbi:hypothetical protein BATDEDRAFT_33849 [Batrachochytrium dendrobatidis JAM81]|uniref:threonine synthase n=1 Tax=Batrachochytrium dendrobatidis (strain JAM81 / FGSC 10211) TaxID=684364 RepID=F4PEQ3_BATDJ|nr:threonine synthase THR4 [Batrachochytrium dendrobatidis JAM81]EGF76310.1 hypothetical protein BATDEDRAFT_33849 [Batrachochytrium dendrobatidis JAM81]|eukprot:XP_006683076.1 hypothetical protein BATDEDRAFT_33849 [Batrachochytrium dendrobatidis JAM81]
MKYRSTRGKSQGLSFEAAVLQGLAPDGGLYIPETIPQVTQQDLQEWSSLTFSELATQLFRKFIAESEISTRELSDICHASFSTFQDPAVVTPLYPLVADSGLWVLELFRGPTFAFKDVALQFLGNLFDFFLQRKNAALMDGQKRYGVTVVGATSGDTGGAAIYGLRGKPDIQVFILHPHERISRVQYLQMTTVLDSNVHNIALKGSFDDCQDIVKQLFSDESLRTKYSLAAINSINWARILAQISYYFYSYFDIQRRVKALGSKNNSEPVRVQYSVPTGNFGDVLAGFYARSMGLCVDKLIIATNENDILYRFMETGAYTKPKTSGINAVAQTLSPAMDILVSSNFERLLWYLEGSDSLSKEDMQSLCKDEDRVQKTSQILAQHMEDLRVQGGFQVGHDKLEQARQVFGSSRVDDEQISDAIARYYKTTGYILDPHTAVGVVSAERFLSTHQDTTESNKVHTICLATASPGKFPEAPSSLISVIDHLSFESKVSDNDLAAYIHPLALHLLMKLPLPKYQPTITQKLSMLISLYWNVF